MELSKLYPCHYKTGFVLTRVTCRLLRNGAMCIAVSLRERGVQGTGQLKLANMKNQKTKVFQLRLTSDELLGLKEKSVPYQSVSNYIRKAVEEFSNVNVKQQIELMQDLNTFYKSFQNELSWAGSNLNQSVKRANELAVAGLLAPSYVYEVLTPVILEMQDTLNKLKSDLDRLNQKTRLIK